MSARFAFVLVPRFSLLALSSAVDALRAANVVSGQTLYEWVTVTPGGGEVEASSGLALRATALEDAGPVTHVAVCGGERSHDWAPEGVRRWLRRRAHEGASVGALSDGSFVVAEAGLFDDVRSTIHWKCLDAYRERYPALDIRASVFELRERRFSCAGGTSALDLLLTMVQRQHGMDLASAVADNYIHDRIRDSESSQRLSAFYHLVGRSPVLARAVKLMEEQVESPMAIAAVAERVGLSVRQLSRLFRRHLSMTPAQYYHTVRIAHARRLLVQTALSVSEVSAATGFCSAAHFARCFREHHGSSPRNYRHHQAAVQGPQ
ncbi:GlxA family transcriptional regulator [Arhodomonas aquaeolei]|uniref:GlxA family transcriptional regulator n=1 Tax=Arhodomonas aquaeolei TaxID=2369 RepID=UPI0021686180|nr:GlxA family transcriptional regulator [Arhodomonas aquaeolei]MCS4505985.1 GlxA family transcriptional regulator [Arhodomonas aquaeolei]